MLDAEVVQVNECLVQDGAVEGQRDEHALVERVNLRVEQVQEAEFHDAEEELPPIFGLPEDESAIEVGDECETADMAHDRWLGERLSHLTVHPDEHDGEGEREQQTRRILIREVHPVVVPVLLATSHTEQPINLVRRLVDSLEEARALDYTFERRVDILI